MAFFQLGATRPYRRENDMSKELENWNDFIGDLELDVATFEGTPVGNVLRKAAAELKAGRERIEALERENKRLQNCSDGYEEFATDFQKRALEAEAARDKALADVGRLRAAGQWAIDVVTKYYEKAWGSGLPRDDERFAPYWKALGTLKETSGEQDG